ncbi:MAG TPA: MFS transporter [Thermoleophilaceae bacterium]|nr:MFS transporter [Thermoleophilaceae bacterium]
MRAVISLLKLEPRARWFFAVLTQSALGTGAAHVALLLIALQRFESPWAVSLVLLADMVPTMLLGPILGAAADRWPRKLCAVVGDLLRLVAFLGIAIANPFAATVAFAVLAGVGNALFKPAVLSALPSLVAPERAAAATSLYGSITDVGFTVGPVITAGALLLIEPEGIMFVNALTFGASAVILWRLAWGTSVGDEAAGAARTSLLHEARLGLREALRMPGLRTVIAATAGIVFVAGLFNVAEPLFATDTIDVGGSGFALLVASFGTGFVVGSLRGAAGGDPPILRRRYLQGLFLGGIGFLATGVAPGLLAAVLTFGLAGFGNGLMLVHERVLFNRVVPDHLQGRMFAVSDTAASWAFGLSYLCAGPLISALGVRETILIAGGAALGVAVLATLGLRSHWRVMVRPNLGQGRFVRADGVEAAPPLPDEDQASLAAPSRSRS